MDDPVDVGLTLEDDDERGVTTSATALDINEGDDATYTVVLTSQPTADVTVGSGTAISGTDFETVTGITVTIPANGASHTGSFTLTPSQDTEDEADETVEVNGTTTVEGLVVTGAEVTIGDAGYTSLTINDGEGVLEGLESSVQRVRLGIEGEVDLDTMKPFWQLSTRYDGGDGQTGTGLDVVAGVRFAAPRVNFEAQGRWLLLHSAAGYEEFSATASLTVSVKEDNSGFMFKLSPRWGQAGVGPMGMGGAMQLWSDQTRNSAWNPTASADADLSFESEVGYGFLMQRGVLKPTLSVSQNGTQGRIYSLGVGYESLPEMVSRILRLQLSIILDTGRPEDYLYGFRVTYQF